MNVSAENYMLHLLYLVSNGTNVSLTSFKINLSCVTKHIVTKMRSAYLLHKPTVRKIKVKSLVGAGMGSNPNRAIFVDIPRGWFKLMTFRPLFQSCVYVRSKINLRKLKWQYMKNQS